ncbi:MAG: hypothetical protein Fues2KO_17810 [Fuerstiella sp.]
MATHTSSTVLHCDLQKVRDYLGQTSNLLKTSDPELELEILNAPEEISEGAVIDFRISAYGFKQSMQHRYVEVSDQEIVAEQTDGPARAWIHRQSLADNGNGSCTLTDRIDFEPPGGMLGFVMTEAKIRESIEDGMEHRYEVLKEDLE